jgi:LAO/AO transport system kinase
MKRFESIDGMVERLLAGDRRMAAQLIALVENDPPSRKEIVKRVHPHTGRAMVVGITGPGGAGKSTLADHITRGFRRQGKTVGIVLVDPSSPFSGGAFLGDRIRFEKHTLDEGVYIRSMAARGYPGGLARAAYDAILIIEAMGVDVVIVETIGVGQDEIDVIKVAQTCLLVVTPGMGDDIQAMKAGILETAHIIAVNKADLDGVDECLKNLHIALDFADFEERHWRPRLIPTVGVASKPKDLEGLDELMQGILEHETFLHSSGAMERIRALRVEQGLRLIFRDLLEDYFSAALDGSSKKEEYIQSVLTGRNDPYSVIDEVFASFLAAKARAE